MEDGRNKRQGGKKPWNVYPREKEIGKERENVQRRRKEAGIASVAVNKRGHEVAGFRNTRKVYGTQRARNNEP